MSQATPSYSREDILTYEVKHAVHCPTPKFLRTQTKDDFHFIKGVLHLKDGRQIPHRRLIKNYERPYGITKPAFRNHQQKKESEALEHLNVRHCTQTELNDKLCSALDLHHMRGQSQRRIQRSPYIYGTDITSTALIKAHYAKHMSKVGVNPSRYTVAGLDIETDMDTNEILMGTVSMGSKVYHIVDESFVAGIADPAIQIKKMFHAKCADLIAKRGIELEVKIVKGPDQVLIEMIQRLHVWGPDFCSIWNINFEFTRFEETIEKYDINAAELFSDPMVPGPFKHFWYKRGQMTKKTSSGKESPKDIEDQWHTVITPASFQFVDGMSAYNFNRVGQGKKSSYSLSNILAEENIGYQKLDFDYVENKTEDTGDWHLLMQSDYKIEYCVYNIMDPILLELLDESTVDLSMTLPTFLGVSDLMNYASQPKRKIDAWHFEFLEANGRMIGSTSDQMVDELDAKIYDLEDWIITLQGWTQDTGLQCIVELPGFATNVRLYNGDQLKRCA